MLNFIFIDSLNHRFSYHPTPNALLQITNQLLFKVSTRSFLCSRSTLELHRNAFSPLAKALQQFLLQKTALSSYSRENNAKEACRLFLCVTVPMCSLATNQLYAVFHHFPTEQSRLGYICTTNFTAKRLQVLYFVIRCEAKFSKMRLKIFKCT